MAVSSARSIAAAPGGAAQIPVALDRRSPISLHRQLYAALRDGIVQGRIGPGTRLPSTRSLARQLGVGRNTVITAFEQLLAEVREKLA